MEETRLLAETVEELLEERKLADLERVLEEQPPEHLADLLEHEDSDDRETLFHLLEPDVQGEVAVLLDDTVREELLEDLPADQIAAMVEELDADEALPLLEDTDPQVKQQVLDRLDPDEAAELRELLGYEEDTAGRAMAFGAPAVPQHLTLGEAVEFLRASAGELDELETVFVVDGTGRLLGYLPLDVLLLRPWDTPVLEAMRRDIVFAYTYEDQEEVAVRAQHSGLLAIPVIDSRGVLRGQIRHDRLREIVEEEATEDIAHLAGLSGDETVHSPLLFSLRRRLPWLYLNLGTAFLAAGVVGIFERTIEKLAVLAVLMGIVAGQGGNAGIQTLTIIVRGLALGDLDWRNSRRAFYKELALGLANGLLVGIVVAVASFLVYRRPWLGLVIFTAMVGNLLAAALAGVAVPLTLKKLRLDPAQASGVFVTTVTDCVGFGLFLGLATMLLPLLQ